MLERFTGVFFLLLLLPFVVRCQDSLDTKSPAGADEKRVIRNFLDRSSVFNIEKKYPYMDSVRLLFEAEFAMPFLISTNLHKKPDGNYAITLVPHVQMRLLHTFSGPIVTPSYIAHLRYHRKLRKKFSDNIEQNYIVSLSHNSNGQVEHIIKDTLINMDRGNFSSHYVNFYYFMSLKKSPFVHHFGLGYEEHLPDSVGDTEIAGGMSSFLSDNFGRHRIIVDYTLDYHLGTNKILNEALLKLHFSLNYSLSKPKGNPIHPEFRHPETLPRSYMSIEAILEPDWSGEVAFFARYRDGQDNYNVYFFNHIRQFQFGIYLGPTMIETKKAIRPYSG